MCDSSGTNDPTTYDRPYCERRIWLRGEMRPCGTELGAESWTDAAGDGHWACREHIVEMRHRWTPRVEVPA